MKNLKVGLLNPMRNENGGMHRGGEGTTLATTNGFFWKVAEGEKLSGVELESKSENQ